MLGLLALGIVLFATFVAAGLWQWDVAKQRSNKAMNDAVEKPVVALSSILRPQDDFSGKDSLQRVRFAGHYDPSRQVLVSGRTLKGQNGYWVVTPVVVDGTGARMPVVRGFVVKPAQASKPSSAAVTVTGALAPGESPSQTTTGILTSVDLPAMLTRWGGTVYNGFVFLTQESPTMNTPGVQAFPPPKPGDTGLNLVNAGYALQWWAFAGLTIYIYGRELRREAYPEDPPEPQQADNRPGGDDSDSAEDSATNTANTESSHA